MDWEVLRKKEERIAIGLMSGTSCDGIDAALVHLTGSGPCTGVRLVDFSTIPYAPEVRARLLAPLMDAQEICILNFLLGELLANAVCAMAKKAEERGLEVDFVASHGHTVAHFPPGGKSGFIGTMQIGESAVIAERTGLPVVSDFRPRDMAAGGQGAPLVPFADWILFRQEDCTVACLNIGGIANITVVPPDFERILAFDTGPGNMIIDGAVRILSRGAQALDKDGKAAAGGRVVRELLHQLLDHPYFALEPPKSAGREQFGTEVYLCEVVAAQKHHSFGDLVATVTEAVGQSIVQAYNRFVQPRCKPERLILSGGGAFNRTLVRLLEQGLPDTPVHRSEEYGIPSDAREAVAFAILGNETVCNHPANVPSATGARRPVILGTITPG